MTKSEIEILRRVYGYRTPKGPVPPNKVPDTDGPTPGCLVQKNTRYHVAALALANTGLVEVYKPVEESTEENVRLVRPGYRKESK